MKCQLIQYNTKQNLLKIRRLQNRIPDMGSVGREGADKELQGQSDYLPDGSRAGPVRRVRR